MELLSLLIIIESAYNQNDVAPFMVHKLLSQEKFPKKRNFN